MAQEKLEFIGNMDQRLMEGETEIVVYLYLHEESASFFQGYG